jgi:hypothetical protein
VETSSKARPAHFARDEPLPHRTARLFAIWRTGRGVLAANALRYMENK